MFAKYGAERCCSRLVRQRTDATDANRDHSGLHTNVTSGENRAKSRAVRVHSRLQRMCGRVLAMCIRMPSRERCGGNGALHCVRRGVRRCLPYRSGLRGVGQRAHECCVFAMRGCMSNLCQRMRQTHDGSLSGLCRGMQTVCGGLPRHVLDRFVRD